MTGQDRDFAPISAPTTGEQVTSVAGDALWLVDLLIEGSVVSAEWIARTLMRVFRRPRRPEGALQVISAMSMVNDHVLRDVGLDRSAMGAISVLSVEEIDGCRVARDAS